MTLTVPMKEAYVLAVHAWSPQAGHVISSNMILECNRNHLQVMAFAWKKNNNSHDFSAVHIVHIQWIRNVSNLILILPKGIIMNVLSLQNYCLIY